MHFFYTKPNLYVHLSHFQPYWGVGLQKSSDFDFSWVIFLILMLKFRSFMPIKFKLSTRMVTNTFLLHKTNLIRPCKSFLVILRSGKVGLLIPQVWFPDLGIILAQKRGKFGLKYKIILILTFIITILPYFGIIYEVKL